MNRTELRNAVPADRLELGLPDAKPTYSAGEAVAEANRCLYCHDAPCVTACPTGCDTIRGKALGRVSRLQLNTMFPAAPPGPSMAML